MVLNSLSDEFPHGKIELTTEVGLVQKLDKANAKDSIDRIIEFIPDASSQQNIFIYEMKVRVAPFIAKKEL